MSAPMMNELRNNCHLSWRKWSFYPQSAVGLLNAALTISTWPRTEWLPQKPQCLCLLSVRRAYLQMLGNRIPAYSHKEAGHKQAINLMNRNSSLHGLHKLLMNLTSYPFPAPNSQPPESCKRATLAQRLYNDYILERDTASFSANSSMSNILRSKEWSCEERKKRHSHAGKKNFHFSCSENV